MTDRRLPQNPSYTSKDSKDVVQKRPTTQQEGVISGTDAESMLLQLVQQHGLSHGARKMLALEESAAQWSISCGVYGSFRHRDSGQDCFRIGPESTCLCGHTLAAHEVPRLMSNLRNPPCGQAKCVCDGFRWIPTRPEMIGQWWLPRRKDFKIHEFAVRCKCGHAATAHRPTLSLPCTQCASKCVTFHSDFACLCCDRLWEDHDTLFESEAERRAAGRTYGATYLVLTGNISPQFREEFLACLPQNSGSKSRKALPAPSSSASSSFSSSSSSSSASSSSNTSSTDRATHRQTDRTQLKQRTVPANKHASAHCHGCGYMFRSPAEEYCPICAHWRR